MPAPTGPRQRTRTGRNRVTLRNLQSKGGNIRSALDRDRTTGQGNAINQPKPQPRNVGSKNLDISDSLRKLQELRQAQNTQQQLRTVQLGENRPGTQGVEAFQNALGAMQGVQANITAAALASMYQGGGGAGGGVPSGPGGPLMKQLRKGFRAAGDTAMAKFVKRRPDLVKIWLGQESGLRPGAISPPNNQGDPNYGLFQFARLDPGARPWLEKFIKGPGAGKFTATPFQQAMLAAKYFDLTPADVKRYVQQINAGTYKGWG